MTLYEDQISIDRAGIQKANGGGDQWVKCAVRRLAGLCNYITGWNPRVRVSDKARYAALSMNMYAGLWLLFLYRPAVGGYLILRPAIIFIVKLSRLSSGGAVIPSFAPEGHPSFRQRDSVPCPRAAYECGKYSNVVIFWRGICRWGCRVRGYVFSHSEAERLLGFAFQRSIFLNIVLNPECLN